MADFQIYKDKAGEYRWRLRADNYEVIADSAEGYVNKSDCEHGIALVKKLALAEIEDRTEEAKVDPTRSESRLSRAAGGISISRNRLGGAGAVELRRGNRLDIFGGLGEEIVVPRDFFDLSTEDEDAAEKLTAALVAPSSVYPFRRFSISWEVAGPGDALSRVIGYQLNVGSFGPIYGRNLEAQGSVTASMWQDGSLQLWAHFGSGIARLAETDVTVDLSGCSDERLPLVPPLILFREDGAAEFLERVQEEAGEDVRVSVLEGAYTSLLSGCIYFYIKLKLDEIGYHIPPGSQEPQEYIRGTVIADLEVQFKIVPRAGHLGANFSPPGYRSVELDADLPPLADAWYFITLGEYNLSEVYYKFHAGLKELAEEFASRIGDRVRGLDRDDPHYKLNKARAPKAVATAIDMSNWNLTVTLCPTIELVLVGGIFPMDEIKADPQ